MVQIKACSYVEGFETGIIQYMQENRKIHQIKRQFYMEMYYLSKPMSN